jgi:thiol:disulfide interchange protein
MPLADRGSTRARPVVLLALAGALLVARLAIGIAEHRHPRAPGGLVRWRSLDAAEGAAVAEHKPLLLDFSAGWCEPCNRMEREVFADGASADLINATFVPVHVADEDQSPAASALRRRFEVDALPTLVVLSPTRKEPTREQGYAGKRRVLAFLRAAVAPPRPTRAGPPSFPPVDEPPANEPPGLGRQ